MSLKRECHILSITLLSN